jgi:diguanylate cyclase (GGDEF)-like protein
VLRSHRYVLITGLVGVLAVAALLLLYRSVTHRVFVEHEERSNVALTQVFANSVWPRYARFTAGAAVLLAASDAASLRARPELARLREDVVRLMRGSSVVKVKLLDLGGLTVFSTDPAQIGEDQSANAGFAAALAGGQASKVAFRDSFDAFDGVLADRSLVSSYVPIRDPVSGQVKAVFEVYSDVTALVSSLERTQARIAVGVAASLSALYLIVLLTARRADRVVARAEQARQAIEAHVHHQAFHDPLTGLPNRTSFSERLHECLQRAQRNEHAVALLFLDLDRFKLINDSLGHAAGDEVLRTAAARLADTLRAGDALFRMGGDEFTVILDPLPGMEHATILTRRLIECLQAPMTVAGQNVIVTASVGIARYPHDAQHLEMLVKHADAAMYRAKDSGRNRACVYSSDINDTALDQLQLETRLRHAVRDGDFVLHYQPRVTPDGELAGAEALLRWQHPELGLLGPDRFLSTLEHSGLMDEVGEWVLREACRQARRWRDDGGPVVRVSVNVSGQQFRNGDLAAVVCRALEESGLDPGLLELELTESTLIEISDSTTQTLQSLRHLGVAIAIDDFGTGYSCLAYLKHLPIQYLKIDRSFVHGMRHDARDTAIVGSIAALAHSLGLGLVAEGVETPADARALKRFDCHELQGFLYGRAVPAARFDSLHRRAAVVALALAR